MKKFSTINIVLLILVILSIDYLAYSQNLQMSYQSREVLDENHLKRCYTMEMHALREQKDPTLKSRIEAFERAIKRKIDQKYIVRQQTYDDTLITIPVVVHVIHQGETVGQGANISAAQIQSQIDVLNEDFRRLNADTVKIDSSFMGLGADILIEFCLAQQDPDGLPASGITRTYKATTGFSNADKALAYWPSDKYLNIWVADLGGGFLGYAQFPDSSGLPGLDSGSNTFDAETDGIAINHPNFGRNTGTSIIEPFNLGRTSTHEVGHWLGLRHIWGDGPCGEEDYVTDTPESDASNQGCAKGHLSCSTLDMVENYMDYSDDSCTNILTLGQKDRIRTVMEISPRRHALQFSKGCEAPNLVNDNLAIKNIALSGEICSSDSINPEVMIRNVGANAVTSFIVSYVIDNGTTQSYSWNGSIASGDTAVFNLPASLLTTGNHSVSAYVSNPNGNNDSDNSNDTITSSFSVSNGSLIDFKLKLDYLGTETSWILVDTATNDTLYAGGTYNDWDFSIFDDDFCLPPGCYDFTIFDAGGNGLCCNGFFPQYDGYAYLIDSNGDTLLFADTFGLSKSVRICISGTGIATIDKESLFRVYPNPTNHLINVELSKFGFREYTITIYDVMGKMFKRYEGNTHTEQMLEIDLSDQSKGIYVIKLQTPRQSFTRKIVLY
ncbi:T9SS type A sorting domain-containing protein [Candidatus Amoebophilus asiaticus]|nr:T9SS type A sorting domain-containing protein [Candidatus Amoebophilus asiaticus]